MLRCVLLSVIVVGLSWSPWSAGAAELLSKAEAGAALRRAVEFFRTQVSASGGYLWRYSEDLSRREGEGKANATTAWVQPPGTPTVGGAYLTAHELTRDEYYLQAARETALALVRGQLRSGGWDYSIEFDPKLRSRYAYRVEPVNEKGRNTTTLDDDTTQAALRFLMRVDRALQFQDASIHEAAQYALDSLLKAQYPNGAWPQRFSAAPDPAQYPVRKASYPESWSRTYPGKNYSDYYTFNDNTIADLITTLLEAAEVYQDARYRAAAEKAGEFILLAQMPDPQPAWAQQYDVEMHPAWARKFEPPAITGGESHGILQILMHLYRETGERKYLEPIPRALDYLKRSELAGGRLARFYELQTNRPLYFTKQYELTYRDDDLPTHYSFQSKSWVDGVRTEYDRLVATTPEPRKPSAPGRTPRAPRMTASLAAEAQAIVAALDARGAWVEDGRLHYQGQDDPTRRFISCETFVDHVQTLARFVAAE
jgi:hypothetical protein